MSLGPAPTVSLAVRGLYPGFLKEQEPGPLSSRKLTPRAPVPQALSAPLCPSGWSGSPSLAPSRLPSDFQPAGSHGHSQLIFWGPLWVLRPGPLASSRHRLPHLPGVPRRAPAQRSRGLGAQSLAGGDGFPGHHRHDVAGREEVGTGHCPAPRPRASCQVCPCLLGPAGRPSHGRVPESPTLVPTECLLLSAPSPHSKPIPASGGGCLPPRSRLTSLPASCPALCCPMMNFPRGQAWRFPSRPAGRRAMDSGEPLSPCGPLGGAMAVPPTEAPAGRGSPTLQSWPQAVTAKAKVENMCLFEAPSSRQNPMWGRRERVGG